MTGTKKQKMNISNSIVETIHSMDPPGRFLKQCPENGQWSELSNKAAADKAAQAMAWVIRGESLKQKRRDRRSRLRKYKAPSLQSQDSVNTKSPQSADPPSDDNSMPPPPSSTSSSLVPHCESLTGTRGAEVAEGKKTPGEVEPTSNLHSQLPQQSSMLQSLSLHQQHLFSHPTVQDNMPTPGTQTQIGFLSPIALNQIQRQLFSQHLLHHHQTFNCPPMSLPPTIIASNHHPLLAGTPLYQSAQTQSNLLYNPLQQFYTPTFRSGLHNLQRDGNSFARLPSIAWGQQQPNQYQLAYLLMLQRNQLSVPSNNILSTHRSLQPQQLGLQLQSPSLLNLLNQAQAAQSHLNTEDSSTTTTQISPSISLSSSITNRGTRGQSLLSSEKKSQNKKRR